MCQSSLHGTPSGFAHCGWYVGTNWLVGVALILMWFGPPFAWCMAACCPVWCTFVHILSFLACRFGGGCETRWRLSSRVRFLLLIASAAGDIWWSLKRVWLRAYACCVWVDARAGEADCVVADCTRCLDVDVVLVREVLLDFNFLAIVPPVCMGDEILVECTTAVSRVNLFSRRGWTLSR